MLNFLFKYAKYVCFWVGSKDEDLMYFIYKFCTLYYI